MFIRGFAWLLVLVSLSLAAGCSGTKTIWTDDPPPIAQAGSSPGTAGASGAAASGAGGASAAGAAGASAGASAAAAGGAAGVRNLTALSIEPRSSDLLVGGRITYSVLGKNAEGQSIDVSWRAVLVSSDPSVAALVGNVLTARAPGQATISAELDGLHATARVSVANARIVRLEVVALQTSCKPADTVQFYARGTLDDGTTQYVSEQVEWSTSAPLLLASVGSGSTLCVSAGAVRVDAKLGALSGSLAFDVIGKQATGYSLSPSGYTRLDRTDRLTLLASYTDGSSLDLWNATRFESDHPDVVRIDGADATAIALGNARLTASIGGSAVASTDWQVSSATVSSLQVSPAQLDLAYPASGRLVATGTFADGSKADVSRFAEWGGSDNQCVSVTEGFVSPWATGTDRVPARLDGVEATAQVTVSPGTPSRIALLDNVIIPIGFPAAVWATAEYPMGETLDVSQVVTWQSSDTTVAVFADPKRQMVVGLRAGSATYQAKLGTFTSDTRYITVTDAALSSIRFGNSFAQLGVGDSIGLSVIGAFDDFSELEVTSSTVWKVGNPAISSITQPKSDVAVLTALSKGKTTVTASVGEVTITVTVSVI